MTLRDHNSLPPSRVGPHEDSLRNLCNALVHRGQRSGMDFFAEHGLPSLMPSRHRGELWILRCCVPGGLAPDVVDSDGACWRVTSRLRSCGYVLLAFKALEAMGRDVPEELAATVTLILASGAGSLEAQDPP